MLPDSIAWPRILTCTDCRSDQATGTLLPAETAHFSPFGLTCWQSPTVKTLHPIPRSSTPPACPAPSLHTFGVPPQPAPMQPCTHQRSQGSCSRRRHERDQCRERRPDAPRRLPVLRVVAGDGQADLHIGLEAAAGGEHDKARGLEGVLGRQQDAAVVDAALHTGGHAEHAGCMGVGAMRAHAGACKRLVDEPDASRKAA